MRLFKKSKKEEPEKLETPGVKVKSSQEIKEERLDNELDYLQKEIKTKSENYESISNKLASVKEEYDSAVDNLMSAKKELNEKKEEIAAVKKEQDALSSKLNSMRDNLILVEKQLKEKSSKLEESRQVNKQILTTNAEIQKTNNELTDLKKKLEESQAVYDKIEMKKTEAETELHNTGLKIESAKHEMLKLQSAIKSGKSIPISKEDEFIEKELSSFEKKENTHQIIEAASAVVASMKTKLSIAQKEVETVNILLKKEREDHQKTREKLEKLEKSKSGKKKG